MGREQSGSRRPSAWCFYQRSFPATCSLAVSLGWREPHLAFCPVYFIAVLLGSPRVTPVITILSAVFCQGSQSLHLFFGIRADYPERGFALGWFSSRRLHRVSAVSLASMSLCLCLLGKLCSTSSSSSVPVVWERPQGRESPPGSPVHPLSFWDRITAPHLSLGTPCPLPTGHALPLCVSAVLCSSLH